MQCTLWQQDAKCVTSEALHRVLAIDSGKVDTYAGAAVRACPGSTIALDPSSPEGWHASECASGTTNSSIDDTGNKGSKKNKRALGDADALKPKRTRGKQGADHGAWAELQMVPMRTLPRSGLAETSGLNWVEAYPRRQAYARPTAIRMAAVL
ncbi:Nucleic acid-binding, OB-fold [Phytophthora cactorum]|nr:Nucleic acid-binding, OB-fold [Phytophthora cactorum]